MSRTLSLLYALVGWAIAALGGIHMFVTLQLASSTPAFRVWFFGSGMALTLVGALNLLHRTYGRTAPGLRVVCWIANFFMTLFAIVAGMFTNASNAERVVIIGLIGGALILSLVRSPIHPATPPSQ